MTNLPEPISFDIQWDDNTYVIPSVVNQASVVLGPPTASGQDGLLYVHLGHVALPPAYVDPDEDGRRVLTVVSQGSFAMSVDRAKELVALLQTGIDQVETIQAQEAQSREDQP